MSPIRRIPVTVFTGYLGSGKTTIIRNLIHDLPSDYKMSLLKNEFGDISVDTLLLQDKNIQVTEMLNGCLCCVLVGKMDNALHEILEKYDPERIIIETSGSAYPAPIAWEINKLKDILELDGIITVIDVLNFEAYKDTSYTAKIQAQYTDLILLNKAELATPERYEKVLDWVNELNSETPKVKTIAGKVDPDLIFGLDSRLKLLDLTQNTNINPKHQDLDADILQIKTTKVFDQATFIKLVESLPKWDFFRIKGYLKALNGGNILNYTFGRYTIEKTDLSLPETQILLLGKNLSFHTQKIIKELGLEPADFSLKLR